MQRLLTADEIADLLNRNFDLNAKVLAHQRIVDAGQWDQVAMNESVFSKLPIPTKGIAVKDDKYGVVVVFPNAAGQLQYSGDVAPAFLNGDINKPPFDSPTGNTLQQFLDDLRNGLGGIVAGLVVVGVLYIVVIQATK